ncbi:MAG TPA: Gfo/Idh/MocA family oxidoreductase [Phycisphaerae bacterium]|nr:Gfo/Idh/MocA family oxidoreductase [Phycisphaerae bacterium]HOB76155.1 Gfo/Idh/MocA family oxidoreductase [Phycisphaerae bacterium]HOJ56177.1 Gfo/Idh/MocA family oxidoreductase [Phycisphaerae bacterium]HOL28259.1 Gfo/Idh/MocA family oxidoreductase [Phycisphaerae bacterium]HPP22641.1 Gfo/Idh/MocA family oxidoreductase [Phycisphaerae bacterium]
MSQKRSTRRQFLKSTAVTGTAIGFPYLVSSSALGQAGSVAPSERIVMGVIGTGGQGLGNMNRLMGFKEVQMVAVCDVDGGRREAAREQVNKKYGNTDCKAYADFRVLLDRKDIDAVIVATPDHWHALISVAAANAGKDIYCEKPLANSVGEGRAIVEAVKRNQRILQTGTQERSGPARQACELVRNGRIGKIHTIEINLPCDDPHHREIMGVNDLPQPEAPVPEDLDYDFWLGHTPKVPYRPWPKSPGQTRCHFYWRFILTYGGGEMTDRGAHVIDIAQLGNDTDNTGPVEFRAKGKRSEKGLYNAFMEYEFENVYANGVRMIGRSGGDRGLKFIGDEGWLFIKIHGGQATASKPSILEPLKNPRVDLGRTTSHHHNFVEAVKTRKQPFATAEIGHRTGSICHLNNIAMITGRPFKWDPVKERIEGDEEAAAMLTPKMRPPWHL